MSKEQVDKIYRFTEDGIYGFFNDHRFLSNFHLCPILIQGIVYPSSEHAYMAMKTDDHDLKLFISQLATPADARKEGQKIKLRPDWEFYRVAAMQHVLTIKFRDPVLKQLLIATGDRYLEETNWWKDVFWGVCNGAGLNMLGKTLMLVRGTLT